MLSALTHSQHTGHTLELETNTASTINDTTEIDGNIELSNNIIIR